MKVGGKRAVSDMSGFCRHSGHHGYCRGVWETPSAIVTCACACHSRSVLVPKARVLVPKKL